MQALASLVDKYSNGDGMHPTAIPGMECLRMSEAAVQTPWVYQPSLCLIVQGEKRVSLNNENFVYAPSQYLAITVDLPAVGTITQASRELPYLCLKIDIDVGVVSELIARRGLPAKAAETQRGLFVGTADAALVDAMTRLATLLDTPNDIDYLAPLAIREVHYRLLQGEHAQRIVQLALDGSNTQRVAQAVRVIRAKFNEPLVIEDLARAVNMSPSSFHAHFKQVTAMSPLQYQKRLRLIEARQRLIAGSVNASNAAYSVGYESASQFSREYARAFGAPPAADIERLRAA
jgi:AraC-like DNA-binding protein